MLWASTHAGTPRTSFDGVALVCDRRHLTASVWTLLKSINARFLIPYRPHVQTLSEIMDSGQMSSTTVDGVVRHDANVCEGVSESATLILDCWHTAQRFGTVLYHIVSYRDILCSIVSYPSFSPTAISCHHYFIVSVWTHNSICLALSYQFLEAHTDKLTAGGNVSRERVTFQRWR